MSITLVALSSVNNAFFLTLILLDTYFVPLGNTERDIGSLAIDEIDNDKEVMSFFAKIWGLD